MKTPILILIAAFAMLSCRPQLVAAVSAPVITKIALASPVHQYLADSSGSIKLTVTVTYTGALSRFGVRLAAPTIPSGSSTKWSFKGATGPTFQPLVGDKTSWEFSYATAPASPITFDVELNYAAGLADPADGATTVQSFAAYALLNNAVATDAQGSPVQTTLTFSEAVFHTADANKDMRLRLDELLKVVQIYNVRNSSTRTGAYTFATSFEPSASGTPVTPTSNVHSADLDKDGTIRFSRFLSGKDSGRAGRLGG